MRVIVTGSSGQIGTNLALRLVQDGHEVFGVDKRRSTWTNDFQYLLQDLSGNYPSYPTGIGGVDYPKADVVVHLAAHAKVREHGDDVQRSRILQADANTDHFLEQP
jgi:UDP-glucose 4-epimerase